MKLLGRTLLWVIAILLLLVVSAVVLILTIDPNRLKPVIEDQLAGIGVDADIRSDLSWQFYPSLGIGVKDMRLATTAPASEPLGEIGELALSVELIPLFSRKIRVDEVRLSNSRLVLQRRDDGSSNWDSLTLPEQSPESTEAAPSAPADNETDIALTVGAFALESLLLQVDEGGIQRNITLESVTATDFNLAGQPFPLALRATADLPNQPALSLVLSSEVSLDTRQKQVSGDSLTVSLGVADSEASVQLQNWRAAWSDPLTAEADLTFGTQSLRQLLKALEIEPQTADPGVLGPVQLNSKVDWREERLTLTNVSLTLDRSRAQGEAAIALQPETLPAVTADIRIDQLNLDHYLPSEDGEATPEGQAPESELPLATLRQLQADLHLQVDQLIVQQAALTNIRTHITANNGLIEWKDTRLAGFDGTVTSHGVFNASKPRAEINGSVEADSLNLGKLASHFAQFEKLAGTGNGQLTFSASGATDRQLIDSAYALARIDAPEASISPFNLEQQYCQLVDRLRNLRKDNQLNEELVAASPSKDWQARTLLRPVTARAEYKKGVVKLDSLSADIEQLEAKASGQFDVAAGAFEFPLTLSLADFSVAPDSCHTIDERWRRLSLPFVCKGTLGEIAYDTCRPDKNRIKTLIDQAVQKRIDEAKNRAEQKIEDKLDDKRDQLEQKASEELQDFIRKFGGSPEKENDSETTSGKENLQDRLRQLIR